MASGHKTDSSFSRGAKIGGEAPKIFINGEHVPELPASDRGLQYGDGLFETIAVSDSMPELLDRHLARLAAGCRRLRLPPPPEEDLLREATLLCNGARACENVTTGILKIILTRGSGGRGYRLPDEAKATRIVSFHPFPDYPPENAGEGIRLRLCQLQLGAQPALAGMKHLNRLENILARAEWDDPEIAEGLLCDGSGFVIEGVMSNLFLVRDGALATPDLSRCGVEGIIRAVVMELAANEGVACSVRDLTLSDVMAADELFLTNSAIGVWPVRELDGTPFSVGPLTKKLAERVAEARRVYSS